MAPRFSVVVPTFQRRLLVERCVLAIAMQKFDGRFEIIVVVDGSTDGTVEALREIRTELPLFVISQRNAGASVARNRGAAAARGEILLFMDDDMEADAQLLAEHDRSHRDGSEVVLGHIPLHPDSPANVISSAVGKWADKRCKRLTSPGAKLLLQDLLTGQISVTRQLFREVGGFDVDFTRNGSFGNEDIDFGYRLWQRNCRIVFNPAAVSYQNYVVGPKAYLKQWHSAGGADVLFARKHPLEGLRLFELNGSHKWTNRLLWRPLSTVPLLARLVTQPVKKIAARRIENGRSDRLTKTLFRQMRAAEYWRGVSEAGGIPRGTNVGSSVDRSGIS